MSNVQAERLLGAPPTSATVFPVCGPGCADPQIAKSAKKLACRWMGSLA
jgi:hypothetical protein